jgi:hypothetical protein
MGQTNVHTNTLTASSITISASDNVLRVSIVCVSGIVLYNGSSSFQGNVSSAITLSAGEGANVTSSNASLPIDGLTINATGGVANVLLSMQ